MRMSTKKTILSKANYNLERQISLSNTPLFPIEGCLCGCNQSFKNSEASA